MSPPLALDHTAHKNFPKTSTLAITTSDAVDDTFNRNSKSTYRRIYPHLISY